VNEPNIISSIVQFQGEYNMKPKYLLQLSVLLALFVSALGPNLTASAAPSSGIIVDRTLVFWDATYSGYVDANRFENWQFAFGQSYTFTVTAIPSSGDLVPLVRLLDEFGVEIASQTGSLSRTQPAGSYSIQIEPLSGSGTYNLTIRQTNNATATPTPLSPTPPTATPIFTSTFTPTPTGPTATATLIPPTSTTVPSTSTPTQTPLPGTPSATPVTPVPGTPTSTSTMAPTPTSSLPNVSIVINPASITVGGTSDGTVNLNNPPASGYTSAEFTCTYDQTLIQVSNFLAGGVFGPDPVMVVNGPTAGSFIVAIAGSNGSEATASGIAFTFDITALQAGAAAVQCTVRVSDGTDTLITIPSTPGNVTVTTAQGNLAGQVLASKDVTVSLYNPDTTLATSAVVNPDGTFNLSALAGNYTVVASAEGFLDAQGAPTLTSGATTTMQTVILLAGDIDGNNVIDQFDAMTIGMNYNLAAPTAADLNDDGTINILDLELLAGNYGQSGALAWLPQ
jgi:hypothetical protein